MDVKKRTGRPDWEDVHSFLVLARMGSFAAAGRFLGVTHVTVRRRLASLEAALGAQLAHRRSTGIVLTPAGQRMLEIARKMELGATEISHLSAGPIDVVSGTVRITATEIFGSYFLMSHLRPLITANPDLMVEIIIDNNNLSLAKRDADLAIRHGRPEGDSLITRHIADYAVEFYASRHYAEKHRGLPLNFLGFTDDVAHLPEADYTARAIGNNRSAMSLNTTPARVAATRAGIGVGLVPKFVARQYPDLVRIDVGIEPLVRELWLVAHPEVRSVARLRVCFDFLVDAFRNARHILV